MPGGLIGPIIPHISGILEGIYVTRIRIAVIGAGISGSIADAIPEGAILLPGGGGCFGGLAGVVSKVSGQEPTWEAVRVDGEVVTVTSLESNGDYALSADPGGTCCIAFASNEPLTLHNVGSVTETLLVPAAGIPSTPSSGNYRVVNLYVDAALNRLTVEYDNTPI